MRVFDSKATPGRHSEWLKTRKSPDLETFVLGSRPGLLRGPDVVKQVDMLRDAQALVVSDVFPPSVGGSGELLSNVYGRFSGVSVTVLTDGPTASQTVTTDGLHVVRDRLRTSQWGLLSPVGFRHHLRRASHIRRLSAGIPTVVHCGRALPEGLGAWLSGWRRGCRYVSWTHGEELAYVASSRELSALMRVSHRHAACLIANSRHTAGMLEAVGIDRSQIEVVYPGVDSIRFRPDAHGHVELRRRLAKPDEVVLLTVGRLQRRKGHDLVLRALADLSGRHGSIRYVIVGDGDERDTLKALAADLGVTRQVDFVGVVPAVDLPTYYAAADVFVHPNRVDGDDFEGFGIVFLEAAAAGLPVIAGRSGGVPEAVIEGVTSLLVSGTSVEELRAALEFLVSHPERRREMGTAGRIRAGGDFSWQRAADQVLRIHRRVAGCQP